MSETAGLARKLQAEGDKLIIFFASLVNAQWEAEVYTEGATWTIRNVLAHFVTSEQGFVKLFTEIHHGAVGVSEDFSIDRYNARQQEKTREMSPSDLLEQYKAVRSEMVSFVSSLQDSDLERMGRHPFLKWTSLREMIKMVYLHNKIHYRDIKKALG